ncbi:MAG: sigma 54-interacting transcriptional regulator [Polyangiaceae bacterium]
MTHPTDEWDDGTTRLANGAELHQISVTSAVVEVLKGSELIARVPIDAAGCVVGTARDCDLRLADDLVSRRHLHLRAEEHGVRIRDLESRNGTFIAGMQIRDVVVGKDTTVLLGDSVLALRLAHTGIELPVSPRRSFGRAIGHSTAMRHVFAVLERAAERDVTVLLEGDSGTGKDVLAVSLHEQSARRDGPFVVVDCGALPANLIESELFGHEKGAFTGANTLRQGAFELADGGTVFLDEVGELPLELQPKLLRALENRSFRRVGGAREVQVDVRMIAATNRGLSESVRQGEFRSDLYYRLAVVKVHVPRLQDRPEDIEPLAQMFQQKVAPDAGELPRELLQLLESYAWPGNARELRNVIERFATVGYTDPRLLFGDAPGAASDASDALWSRLSGLPYHEAKQQLVDRFHQEVLPKVVEQAGSITAAAERLGLPRSSLHRMLKKLQGDDD